jgi:hypothetical protein
MTHPIPNLQDAQKALDYFNLFHDAFIKKLCVTSYDRFEERGVQSLSGHLDVEILFSHYNYREGKPPPGQIIRAVFYRAREIQANFLGVSYEWSVNRVEVREAQRKLETNQVEACLELVLWQPRLNDRREWEHQDVLRFSFSSGEFVELDSNESS